MKHPVPVWARVCGLLCLCLSPLSQAKAPPAVRAVRLTAQEVEALQDLGPAEDRCKRPEVIADQSFRLQQKESRLDGAMLVSISCRSDGYADQVRFALYRDGKRAQLMPEHRANTWAIDQVEALSFSDVDDDGLVDIVAIVSASAGAGPTAAVPFNVAGVWFQSADGTFVADPKADAILEKVREPSVRKAVAALRKAHVRQH
jgi:hypothetical protein